MKFLALKHHVQLHPGLVVSKNPQNIVAPLEGYRASLTCLVKSTHVFDWDLKKQVEIWRNKCPSIFFLFFWFYRFPIFSCFTDFITRQVGHLYRSAFILLQSFSYYKCKGNTSNQITNQGTEFAHNSMVPQLSDFVFCFHFDWRAYIHAPEWFHHFANPEWIVKW